MKSGEDPTAGNKMFCNGAVTSWYKVLSSFNVWFRGIGRGTDTVLRTLALLLAAHSRETPKQAKEPFIRVDGEARNHIRDKVTLKEMLTKHNKVKII